MLANPLNIATRKSSEAAIEVIAAAMPFEFVAGSADLTGSNNNKAKSAIAFSAKTPKGRKFTCRAHVAKGLDLKKLKLVARLIRHHHVVARVVRVGAP